MVVALLVTVDEHVTVAEPIAGFAIRARAENPAITPAQTTRRVIDAAT
jgi:hypothetical protein